MSMSGAEKKIRILQEAEEQPLEQKSTARSTFLESSALLAQLLPFLDVVTLSNCTSVNRVFKLAAANPKLRMFCDFSAKPRVSAEAAERVVRRHRDVIVRLKLDHCARVDISVLNALIAPPAGAAPSMTVVGRVPAQLVEISVVCCPGLSTEDLCGWVTRHVARSAAATSQPAGRVTAITSVDDLLAWRPLRVFVEGQRARLPLYSLLRQGCGFEVNGCRVGDCPKCKAPQRAITECCGNTRVVGCVGYMCLVPCAHCPRASCLGHLGHATLPCLVQPLICRRCFSSVCRECSMVPLRMLSCSQCFKTLCHECWKLQPSCMVWCQGCTSMRCSDCLPAPTRCPRCNGISCKLCGSRDTTACPVCKIPWNGQPLLPAAGAGSAASYASLTAPHSQAHAHSSDHGSAGSAGGAGSGSGSSESGLGSSSSQGDLSGDEQDEDDFLFEDDDEE